MRDAFGGSFMIKLFLVFIAIYIAFTAVALNYAKAFKVKNKVIEYLEKNEIADLKNISAAEANAMEEYFEKEILGEMNYRATIDCKDDPRIGVHTYKALCGVGIRIDQFDPNEQEKNKIGVYYKVTTTIGWTIPFINNIAALNGSSKEKPVVGGTWTISGETRPIVNEK